VLGPEDTFTIRVPDAEEFNEKPFRVDSDGYVNVPLLGRLRAAGLNLRQFEADITRGLKTYYLQPEVGISLTESRSRPVSILGAVTTPGIQYLRGGERLVEMIARAGGLLPEAGPTLTVSRRLQYGRIPLPTATDDPTRQVSTVEVDLNALLKGSDPTLNIRLEPQDALTVSRADMVYVLGEVSKSGAFVINNREEISVLKALALAGGLSRTAAAGDARILLHGQKGQNRQEVPINLNRIMKSKESDIALHPEDILFVPSSTTKRVAVRTLEAAIGIGSGVAIWRSAQ
jgi:polysaccharide export outer membrane protein